MQKERSSWRVVWKSTKLFEISGEHRKPRLVRMNHPMLSSLGRNNIRDSGAHALARALNKNETLEQLQ